MSTTAFQGQILPSVTALLSLSPSFKNVTPKNSCSSVVEYTTLEKSKKKLSDSLKCKIEMYGLPKKGQWAIFGNNHNTCLIKMIFFWKIKKFISQITFPCAFITCRKLFKNCLSPWTHDLPDSTKVNETYRRGDMLIKCWFAQFYSSL